MTFSYVQSWYNNLLYGTAHNPLYETTHIATKGMKTAHIEIRVSLLVN